MPQRPDLQVAACGMPPVTANCIPSSPAALGTGSDGTGNTVPPLIAACTAMLFGGKGP